MNNNPLIDEKKKLLQEIFSYLEENTPDSLLPALRKVVRLADLLDEQEYRFLFQRHIDGWPKGNQTRTDIQKWRSNKPPRWDVLGMVMDDRTDSEGMIQSLSLKELEDYINETKEIIKSDYISVENLNTYSNIISIHNRIATRVLDFATIIQKRLNHTNVDAEEKSMQENKKHIFIGHGRSNLWRDVKDFLQERLKLVCDEFNREPTAGITTIERLEMMLLLADFAFIVMTGEDEHSDGSIHARENVIHEIGLFQGKLGFKKAIILLEEGCSEFSNIHGLTQIRFPKGNILSKSEEIRRVLERESILKE